MGFKPLHDRVLIRRVGEEEKSAGGIIIPDTAQEKPSEGEIVAVGSGVREEAEGALRRGPARLHPQGGIGSHIKLPRHTHRPLLSNAGSLPMLQVQNTVGINIKSYCASTLCPIRPWYRIANHFVLLFERKLCVMIIEWSFNRNTVCLNQKARLG